jgi:hypothetical protein
MSIATQIAKAIVVCGLIQCVAGCEESPVSESAAKSRPSAAAVHSARAPEPPPPPPAPVLRQDCPEGSTGEGTFNHPCEAKGALRTMDVAWTKKITDDGPQFRVTNKSKLVILYGKIAVYFYDKAGKQLEIKGEGESAKPRQFLTCSGKIFGGVMKVAEKALLTFSCVKKDQVPEGTTLIEGELQMVGFTDASGEKIDFYWHNDDLAPKERPKGGVK